HVNMDPSDVHTPYPSQTLDGGECLGLHLPSTDPDFIDLVAFDHPAETVEACDDRHAVDLPAVLARVVIHEAHRPQPQLAMDQQLAQGQLSTAIRSVDQ